jgi:Tfp pilus assembly protein FimT
MNNIMKNFYKKGIGIVEILVTIAIIGVIATFAIPEYSKMKKNETLKTATSDIVSTLNKARSQTLDSLDSSEYGVHFETDKVTVFKGTVFSATDSKNQIIEIISPVVISNISLMNGASDIYFNRLTGVPNITGSIIISIPSDQNLKRIINISSTGSIGVN